MEPTTIEDALALIEERPDDSELHQKLGLLYLRNGRYDDARAAYEHSLELAPDDPWTHLYLGNWCYYVDRFAEALEWFRRAAELLPDHPIAFSCQGDIYRTQGRYDLARAAYWHALQLDPEDDRTRRKLMELRVEVYGDDHRPIRKPTTPRPNLVTRGRECRTPDAR